MDYLRIMDSRIPLSEHLKRKYPDGCPRMLVHPVYCPSCSGKIWILDDYDCNYCNRCGVGLKGDFYNLRIGGEKTMEEITKKEAIQALSEHFHIPIQTIVAFVRNESKEEKTAKEYRIQMFPSLKEANDDMERTLSYGWRWKPISITTKGDGGALYILFERRK